MRAFALALTVLALPSPVLAQIAQPAIAGTRLDVVARGEVRRVPDIATITAGVVTQASDARTALSDNAVRMSRLLAALKGAGVAERDVRTSQISLNPQYRYAENQPPAIIGYQANNSVSVRFRGIARAGGILDALVAQGANQINGPELSLDQPDAALDEARLDAVKTARARAELYARAAGLTVRRIVAISESGDGASQPPTPVLYARSAAAAKTEIAPGEQTLGVTLSVIFELG